MSFREHIPWYNQADLQAGLLLLFSCLAQTTLAETAPLTVVTQTTVTQAAATPAMTLQTLSLPSGEDLSFEVYGYDPEQSSNKQRVLWIAPGFGLQERHKQLAQTLGTQGMEVWQIDLAEALFLTRGSQTMREIPAALIADIISTLSEQGKHRLLIISGSYGAIPVLRGIHNWQSRHPDKAELLGVVLFSPALFTHVPQLGETPTLIPEAYATNVPVYIFLAEKNPVRWHLPAMLAALQTKAPVYTELLKGVTAVFYEEDKSSATLNTLKALPKKIQRAIQQLQSHPVPLRAETIAATPPSTDQSITQTGLDASLKPYRGSVQPETFSLTDTQGKTFTLDKLSGKVTLINFWATWCPPCVQEIPSLNRLKQQMQGKPFQLISIDYAEDVAHIRDFMQKVNVDFPVLLDTDGSLAGKWKVVAFPSTFVIGPDAKIHFGVNAGIHWDTPDVVEQLNRLMQPIQ